MAGIDPRLKRRLTWRIKSLVKDRAKGCGDSFDVSVRWIAKRLTEEFDIPVLPRTLYAFVDKKLKEIGGTHEDHMHGNKRGNGESVSSKYYRFNLMEAIV